MRGGGIGRKYKREKSQGETIPTRSPASFFSLSLFFFLISSLFLLFTAGYFSRVKIHAKNRRAAKREEAQSESLPENDGHTGNVPLSGTSDSRTQIRVRHLLLLLLLFRHHRLLLLLHHLLLLFCSYSRNIAWRKLVRKNSRVTTDEKSRCVSGQRNLCRS